MTEKQSTPNMGLLQEKYTENAGTISRFAVGLFNKQLAKFLDQVQGQTVFDAGCGEGHILKEHLQGRFPHILGADLDMARLQYAQDSRLFQGNLHHIPLGDSAVDLVICLEVLEHVGEPEKALDELYRVTSKYAILSVPNEPFWRMGNMLRGKYWSEWGNTPEHINHWSVWSFKRFVGRRFHVIQATPTFLWSFILAEKK